MKQKKLDVVQKNRDTALLLLSVGFLLGGLLGIWAERQLPMDENLVRFLADTAQNPMEPSLLYELFVVLRWPFFVLILSFFPFVGLTMPALFCIRGFLLSYGIAAVTANVGFSGTFCAILLFGPICFLTVPVLFILGTEALMRKADEKPQKWAVSMKVLGCVPPLILCIILDCSVTPMLLTRFLNIL